MSSIDYNRLNGPQRKILRETLISVFRRARNLDMFLVESGFEPLEDVVESGPFKSQVFELIGELRRVGRLAEVVEAVVREHPDSPEVGELGQRLRFADEAAAEQRVLGAGGLERMVRNVGFQDLNAWAARLVELGRQVCRIGYPVPGGEVCGTGFLVAGDLLLTNYHVIEPLLDGRGEPTRVELSFEDAGAIYRLGDEWLLAHAPYSAADVAPDAGLPADHELDFALLRLATSDAAEETAAEAPAARGWIDLAALAIPQRDDAVVFVLQHPRGEPLKQSTGVLQPAVTELRVRYDADTDHGSSGGLVLDQRLAPLALHHAGDPSSELRAEYNQGIPLELIRQALASNAAVPRFW